MTLCDFSTFNDVTHLTVDRSPFEEIQNSVSELARKVQELYMTGPQESGSGKNMSRKAASLSSAIVLSKLFLFTVNSSHMALSPVLAIREDFLQCKLL